MKKPEYSDDAILIRPYKSADIDSLFEAGRESINEVYPWLPWCHPEYSRRESREWVRLQPDAWDRGEAYNFAIIARGSGRYIGGCGINLVSRMHRFANLGYWVRTSCAGQGAATAATRLLARFGFEELKLIRIEILAAVGNHASQRVAEKAGAKREGVLRNRLLLHNQAHDAVMFSLVPEEIIGTRAA
jgi:RimJ/RimL family protein N-acetyltransferase